MSERVDNLDEQQHESAAGEPATMTVTVTFDDGHRRDEFRTAVDSEAGCRSCLAVKAVRGFFRGLDGLVGVEAASAGYASFVDQIDGPEEENEGE